MHRYHIAHRLLICSPIAAVVASLALGASCFQSSTRLCEASGLRCREGQVCAPNQAICVDKGGCGDGIVDGGEVCDDGNQLGSDGCNEDCTSDESCGNDIKDPGEECDDGNTKSLDGCSADCTDEFCGDRVVTPNIAEQCDTGGDSQACDEDCTLPTCGDGYTNTSFVPPGEIRPEVCDNKGGGDTAACNGNNHGGNGPGSCQMPVCGDRYTNPMFTPPGDTGGEACDQGNDTPTCNGNNAGSNGPGSCQVPACGDHYRNPLFIPPGETRPEACDEGGDEQICNGNNDGAGGVGSCQAPLCGDRYTNTRFSPSGAGGPAEKCDDGADSLGCNGGNDGIPAHQTGTAFARMRAAACQPTECGDGYVNQLFHPSQAGPAETCDDGGNSTTCNGGNDEDTAHQAGSSFDRMIAASCQPARCGDGYVNPSFKPAGADGTGEACDDGGNSSTCNGSNDNVPTHQLGQPGYNEMITSTCHKSKCGDGYVNPSFHPTTNGPVEACDEGSDSETCNGNKTGNSGSCQIPSCGDGYVNPQFKPNGRDGEECDRNVPCIQMNKFCDLSSCTCL